MVISNQLGIIAFAVTLQMERVEFKNDWFIKSSFTTNDEMIAYQCTKIFFPKTRNKN
jgi:hypothetical protein